MLPRHSALDVYRRQFPLALNFANAFCVSIIACLPSSPPMVNLQAVSTSRCCIVSFFPCLASSLASPTRRRKVSITNEVKTSKDLVETFMLPISCLISFQMALLNGLAFRFRGGFFLIWPFLSMDLEVVFDFLDFLGFFFEGGELSTFWDFRLSADVADRVSTSLMLYTIFTFN